MIDFADGEYAVVKGSSTVADGTYQVKLGHKGAYYIIVENNLPWMFDLQGRLMFLERHQTLFRMDDPQISSKGEQKDE